MSTKEIMEKIDFDEFNIIYNDFVDYIKTNHSDYQELLKKQKDITKANKLKMLYSKFDTDLRSYLFIFEKMLDILPKIVDVMQKNQETFTQLSQDIKKGTVPKNKEKDYLQMEQVYMNSTATIFYKFIEVMEQIILILDENYSVYNENFNVVIQNLEKEIEKNQYRTEFFNLNAQYFTEKVDNIALLQNSIHALI